MGLLAGHVAVITGGAQGLGYAVAERYVSEGCRVVLADLNEAALASATQRLGGGDIALSARCDVSVAGDVKALLANAVEAFGRVDVMVNNAGITRDATMRKMTEQQFDDVIAVHLKGAWNGTRQAAEVMRECRRGSIVNMSSLSGKVGGLGQTNYSAAKAGIVGLTKAAAKELGRYGVRANAIAPGLIRTSMTEALPTEIWDKKVADIPLGRAGEPDEVGGVALFLASSLSSYVTGAVIDVGGGRFM